MREPEGYDETPAAVPDQGDTDTSGYDGGGTYRAPEGGSTDPSDRGHDDPSPDGDTSGPGTMRVQVDGQARELPAEKDYTGDGRPDAAAETSDGKVIIFADTEDNETGEAGPDGRADEAYVVDKSTGRVVGAAHVDPRTGEWVDGIGDPSAQEQDN
jgi:hypothetical protein